MKKTLTATAAIALLAANATAARLPAFPTAEGYGMYTVGGRGGDVYEVTNLNDSGKGSLRQAVNAKGPRTVVFRVSGTIELKKPLTINNPYITIAGQTAPGDGICIKDYPLNISADEVIIRHLRVRLGDRSGQDADAISCRGHKNIILDHISASWSIDETMSIYMCENVTIQWCIISESLFASNHIKGNHGFGGIWGNNYATYHHNLIACHSSRNPRFASGAGYNDYRNNVIYNWGYNSCYGGEKDHPEIKNTFGSFTVNMVANYYKPGPATQPGRTACRIAGPSFRGGADNYGKWYVADNIVEGCDSVSRDNWNGGMQPTGGDVDIEHVRLGQPWPAMPIRQETAARAYISVLAGAGATLPRRDAVDTRIVDEARSGKASVEGKAYKARKRMKDPSQPSGIIDTPEDAGGWPTLRSLPAPTDSDHDGMPDAWEAGRGLDPYDPADRNTTGADGYTMLEAYINSL